jgi:hypothetical protein
MAMPALLSASNGELLMVAEAETGHSGNIRECGFWSIKYRGKSQGNSFGSCRPPVILVYADLQGASADGITGAEFAGLIGPDAAVDPNYLLIEIPSFTASQIVGRAFSPPDPFSRGMNIGWNACQNDNGRVFLERILVIPLVPCGPEPTPAVPQLVIGGAQHGVPNNPLFRCPLFTLCDMPAFTKVCLGTNITMCPHSPIPGFCGVPGRPPCPSIAQCSTSGSFTINPVPEMDIGDCTPVGKSASSSTDDRVLDDTKTWSTMKGLYR